MQTSPQTPQPLKMPEDRNVIGPLKPQQFALIVIGGFAVYLVYKFAPFGVFLGVFLVVLIAVIVIMKKQPRKL